MFIDQIINYFFFIFIFEINGNTDYFIFHSEKRTPERLN